VGTIPHDVLEDGMVVQLRKDMMATGPRAVLSLDIGGTKLAVAVVTEDGRTHGLVIEPTRREEGPGVIVPRLLEIGHRAIAASGIPASEISAVGISCGGPLDAETGVLTGPLHLPGWVDVPIVDLVSQEFGVPAVLANDATVGALGEFRYGAARDVSTMVYLTISTGIGGGAVIDGRLHRGAAGNGGEFGHVMVRTGGRPCLCGRRGCLECYASGTSIALRAREAVAERGTGSVLAGIPEIRSEDVVAAASAGDPLAVELWEETIDVLSVAITDLVNVFEPDLVVLGGGVTRSGDVLIEPIRARVAAAAMPPAAAASDVVLAGLGDVVCVVGAGAVAFDRLDLLAGASLSVPEPHHA
jgi:glucokinase